MKDEFLVRAWMSSPAQVVKPDTSVADAYNLMMQRGIRRLPVVERGRLVGIVTLGDLREARPSTSTGLSIYELNFLLSGLAVEQIMTHTPLTVALNTPVIQAARIMLDRKIGGLPVIDEEERLLGIITESDIFRVLIHNVSSQQSSA